MTVVFVDELSLGAIMPGVALILPPLLAGLDIALTGQFGLGALAADISAQLNAALSVSVQLGLAVSNPFATIQAQLQALIQIQASLQASLSLGLPVVSASISASISANAGIAGVLSAQIGGIQALIKASLALKIPIVALLASLEAGPVDLLSVGITGGTDPLATVGTQLNALAISHGIGTLLPTDEVAGVIILTKVPSATVAIQSVFGL
jgi:hypothetical protein